MYEVEVLRTTTGDKADCLSSILTLDEDKCESLGTQTVTTNTSITVGGSNGRGAGNSFPMGLLKWMLRDGDGGDDRPMMDTLPAVMFGTDVSSDSLYTVDLSTGAYTLVGSTGINNPRALEYNDTNGLMYSIHGGNRALYTVSISLPGSIRG